MMFGGVVGSGLAGWVQHGVFGRFLALWCVYLGNDGIGCVILADSIEGSMSISQFDIPNGPSSCLPECVSRCLVSISSRQWMASFVPGQDLIPML